jgi:cell division protein FtsL
MIRITVILAGAVMALMLLWERNTLVHLGLEIKELQKQEKALLQEHHELLIEISSLSSYRRIEQIATSQIGMIRPDPHQVVMVLQGEPVKAKPKPQPTLGGQQVADLRGLRFEKLLTSLGFAETKD